MAMDLEDRVQTLESDKSALEYLVIYLAKKNLMREPDPVAAATAMNEEIRDFAQTYFNYVVQKHGVGDVTTQAVSFSSGISLLADRILEDIKADIEQT